MDQAPNRQPTALEKARRGEISLAALIALLVVLGAVVLGLASLGGWGGVVAIAAVMAAFVALLFQWLGLGSRKADS